MTAIREPVWSVLHCNSFATLSDHAVFLVTYLHCSDIFTLNTVGVKTHELKPLFHIQQTYQSIFFYFCYFQLKLATTIHTEILQPVKLRQKT